MPAPVCLAMVVCDSFYKDPFTGKHTLIGTFSGLMGTEFPLTHPHITINVALTDGHGRSVLRLEMVDVDEEREAVFNFDGTVTFAHPRDVVKICFKTPAVSVPEAGEYRLRLFADGEFIMERTILATLPEGFADDDEFE